MRVKNLFLLSGLVALALSIGICAALLANVFNMRQILHQRQYAFSLHMDISALQSLASEYLLHPKARIIDQWRRVEIDLRARLAASPFTTGERAAAIGAIADRTANASERFRDLRALLPPQEALPEAEGEARHLARKEAPGISLQLPLQESLARVDTLLQQTGEDIARFQSWAQALALLLVSLTGVSIVAISLILRRSVAAPLEKLSRDVGIIAAGDRSHRTGSAAANEIGEFSRTLDAMLDTLQAVTVSRDELAAEVELRRRGEERLRAGEAALQREKLVAERYFSVASVMLCVLDATGRIALINPRGCEILGYEMPELVGRDWFEAILPESVREGVRGVFKKLMAGTIEPVEYNENPVLRKDGEERLIAFHNAVIASEDGTAISGVLFSGEDITQRRKGEEELAALNRKLEELVNGRTAELKSESAALQSTQQALVNIVEDLNQKSVELGRANDKLKELDRMKSMFIASMSHELRTPLNSIIGFSSIMLEEWVGPLNEEQKKNMATVLHSGKHLLSLINDVIDVSKIEAGKIESAAEQFDLQDVVAEAAALLRNEAEQKGLVLEVDAGHQVVHSDRRRLLQCLANLISNAVKFTERGLVTIRTAQVKSNAAADIPDLAEIIVTDTGIGMREEDLGKLFSAFFRIYSPLSEKVKGTGLGLYLVRKIVEEILQGQVTVTSVYGAGSSFTLRIPLSLSRGDG